MATFLLTNNPRRWDFDPDDLAYMIKATGRGRIVTSRWSTGRSKRIQPEDRIFLLRQGSGPRGIFASGIAATAVRQASDWDGSGDASNIITVEWDTFIDPAGPLPLETLQSELPQIFWTPRGNGNQIPGEAETRLERLWAHHVGDHAADKAEPDAQWTGSQSQGWQLESQLRQQLEDLAQTRLSRHYIDSGWTVTDRRHGNPFDAEAVRGDEHLYLEAKGTVTAGDRVIVTRGEVEFARRYRGGRCVIGILTDILVGPDGVVDPDSGHLQLYRWDPQEADLHPTEYLYRPDPAGALNFEPDV